MVRSFVSVFSPNIDREKGRLPDCIDALDWLEAQSLEDVEVLLYWSHLEAVQAKEGQSIVFEAVADLFSEFELDHSIQKLCSFEFSNDALA